MMRIPVTVLAAVLLWGGLFHSRTLAFDTPNLPDATAVIKGSLVVPPNANISIPSHRGEWGAFFGTGGDGESYFLIAGEVENTAGKPLTYVKFQFELLNKDGTVVMRDYGYNRKAEALREEEYETGKKTLAEMKLDPLQAKAKDGFRFFFFKSETPVFHTYRIRFLESH